jgi:hypothetical protein
LLVLALVIASGGAGCQSLLGSEPTPVPGAAATLTRSSRTPIPTPLREPSTQPAASLGPSPSPVRPASSPVASTRRSTDEDVAEMQRTMNRIVASRSLPDIESLLLDRVSLSTPAGGEVLDRAEAAAWLRDHADPGITVERVDASTQTLMLEVQTAGWPNKDPIEHGRVTFSMRRYGANGRPDEDNGDWKVDVMTAE